MGNSSTKTIKNYKRDRKNKAEKGYEDDEAPLSPGSLTRCSSKSGNALYDVKEHVIENEMEYQPPDTSKIANIFLTSSWQVFHV